MNPESPHTPTTSLPEHPAPAEVVLASQSPRRRRLLEWLGLPFAATAVDTPEDLDSPLASDPAALAASLAAEKATAARDEGHGATGLVLCFDTIVVLDGAVLGKPRDERDAWRMLRALSGRTHQVVTGVAALTPELAEPVTFAVTTDVAMQELSDCRIEAWMAMGTFLGCAGAYNIEAQVASVGTCDCYQNVAGLPLCHVYAALIGEPALRRWLPAEPHSPVAACDDALERRCELGPDVLAEAGANR
ncbi:MAG: septum formation protein Maf [Coriobacteriia bacterium]|nr:septum formation protein Maf [Coriobacteriia bacterium]